MNYIEAPTEYNPQDLGRSLFMAGGITGCPDWQQDLVKMLSDTDITILNPRRANFPIQDPKAADLQIRWEYFALRDAMAISFWFPKETICPIVLYELGAFSTHTKSIFVGVHPEYQRRQDVEIQMRLARPDLSIVYSLQDLASQLKS